jgi:hypothetical protein
VGKASQKNYTRRFYLCFIFTIVLTFGLMISYKASGVPFTFKDDFKGVPVTLPDGRSKLYPDTKNWAFTFWPGIKWPDSYGDGTNWLAGNSECQTYVTPLAAFAGKTPVPAALRYDPFSIKPDGLHIKAAALTHQQQAAYHVGGGRRFGSGMLLSHFAFTYGKVRMVAKLPSARGSWPAFWLLSASHTWPPEIDIFEAMAWGTHTHQIHAGLLVPKGEEGEHHGWYSIDANPAEGFHEYGLDWDAKRVTVLFDGKVVMQQPTPASMQRPMYLITNLAVGGQWPYNELGVKPIDGKSDERLAKGSDLIEADYPAEMIIKSITVSSPFAFSSADP